MTTRFLTGACLAALLLSGCASSTTVATANPYPAVPPPIAETVPKPPVAPQALLWQPGHWDWNGSGYAWQPGEYVPAGNHGPLFQQGYWAPTATGWVWQPAHWTS